MFERFTDRARRATILAQEEARMLSHNYIGTEHILLGLIHEGEGVAAKALGEHRVSLEAVRERIETIVGEGEHPPGGHIPFTPRAKKVVELSLREALQLGHGYIGTEHVLLALLREGDGIGMQVLDHLQVDREDLRDTVTRMLQGRGALPKRQEPAEGELLTPTEFEVVELAGLLWNKICDVVDRGPTRESDLDEFKVHIHAIQHAVMAQAAARRYPDNFRSLGESLSRLRKLEEVSDAEEQDAPGDPGEASVARES